jgi:hypothetical protein
MSTMSEEMGFPDVLLSTRGKMDVRDFLPNLEDLHLRVTVAGLQHHARTKQISINAGTLRAFGTHWKRVHISMPMPELFLFHLTTDPDDVKVPYIASLSDTYLRFQRAMMQLGGHLMRRLGTFQPPKRTEQPWDYEAREARRWYVSDTMHPCSAYERDSVTALQSWFDIKDSMNDETGEWHLHLSETSEKSRDPERIVVLQHTGLRSWSAPMLSKHPFLAIPAKEHSFERDVSPKFGSEEVVVLGLDRRGCMDRGCRQSYHRLYALVRRRGRKRDVTETPSYRDCAARTVS